MEEPSGRPIDHADLEGRSGISKAAIDAVIAVQPRTVAEALRIPGVGRTTARRLVELGLTVRGHPGGNSEIVEPANRPILPEHFQGQPGLTQAAIAALVAQQPKTVTEALRIPGVGRKTTRRLLKMGLITDAEGKQTR